MGIGGVEEIDAGVDCGTPEWSDLLRIQRDV
jgi:hypothetical protein